MISGERNEAEAQGQQAREAVHLLTKGADIAFDDQLDAVQKEILENALAYFEKFTKRASGNPAVRLEHGLACQQMGDIQRKLGRLGESETAYRKAIALLEPLTGAAGAGREAKQALARTRTLLGDVLVRRGADKGQAGPLYAQALEAQRVLADAKKDPAATTEDILRVGQTYRSQGELARLDGQLDEARATYTRAIAELERAVADDAKKAEARNELAMAVAARGLTHRDLGDAAAAEADYRRSVDLAEKLVAEFPTMPRHREALASSCNYLGWLEQEAGRLDDAEKHLRREVALTRRLAEDYPDRTEYRRMLARGLTDFGSVLRLRGQIAEADPVLRQAIELDTAITAKSPDDVRVRHQLAIAHHGLGLVLSAQGDAEAAIGSFQAARSINEDLVKQFPDRPRYAADLAASLDGLAIALSERGRPGADESFRAAGAIYDKLVAAHPDNAQYRIQQAISMRNQGAVLAEANRPEQAEAVLRKALALLDAGGPRVQPPDWQRTQAELLVNLGKLQRPGSEDALRRSIAISEKLLAGKVGTGKDRSNLASAENNLGDLMMKLGRLPEAAPHFAAAAGHMETLVAEAPRSMDHQYVFGIVLGGQAKCLDQMGKTAEAKGVLTAAVEHSRQAVELSRNAPVCRLALADRRIELADVNRKLGAYDEAAKLALEVPKTVPASGRAQACFDAARALARLVVQLGGDLKVPQAERDHLTRVYLTRTVVLLRDAVDANPELSGPIKADRDLKVLESRPDFQAILNTLVEAGR